MSEQYKPTPDDLRQERIRERTDKIVSKLHTERLQRNKKGSWAKDWETAEKIVRNPVFFLLYKAHRPFIWVEKRIWEPALHWSDRQAWLNLLSVAGNVGLIVAACSYVVSEQLRRDAEVFTAWQVITSADGQSGNGGRIKALEFLNASPGSNWRRKFPWFCAPLPLCTWPAESLDGINFAAPEGSPGVYLRGVKLPKASLRSANLQDADLGKAELQYAGLEKANLQGADLGKAELQGADLGKANLQGAKLNERANLQDADLTEANLRGADLVEANLQDAVRFPRSSRQ